MLATKAQSKDNISMVKDLKDSEELSIEELRRKYDKICSDYNSLRTRVLAFLGGVLALITFLFGGSKDFPPPDQLYGKIFYFTAIGLLIVTFIILFRCASSILWASPVERKEIASLKKRYRTNRDFLEYVRNEYLEALDDCISKQNARALDFDIAIKCLFIGGIILMVIKFTNGG